MSLQKKHTNKTTRKYVRQACFNGDLNKIKKFTTNENHNNYAIRHSRQIVALACCSGSLIAVQHLIRRYCCYSTAETNTNAAETTTTNTNTAETTTTTNTNTTAAEITTNTNTNTAKTTSVETIVIWLNAALKNNHNHIAEWLVTHHAHLFNNQNIGSAVVVNVVLQGVMSNRYTQMCWFYQFCCRCCGFNVRIAANAMTLKLLMTCVFVEVKEQISRNNIRLSDLLFRRTPNIMIDMLTPDVFLNELRRVNFDEEFMIRLYEMNSAAFKSVVLLNGAATYNLNAATRLCLLQKLSDDSGCYSAFKLFKEACLRGFAKIAEWIYSNNENDGFANNNNNDGVKINQLFVNVCVNWIQHGHGYNTELWKIIERFGVVWFADKINFGFNDGFLFRFCGEGPQNKEEITRAIALAYWLQDKNPKMFRVNETAKFIQLVIYKEVVISESHITTTPAVCPICFDEVYNNSVSPNCGHEFCRSCFEKWMRACRNEFRECCCPCCRQLV